MDVIETNETKKKANWMEEKESHVHLYFDTKKRVEY
jgi:hypothetical protein